MHIIEKIRGALYGSPRRKRVSNVLTGLTLVAATAAAAWLITGDGPGRGQIGSLQAPTVSAGTVAPSTALVPGGKAAASFTVENPNSVDLVVTAAAAAPGATTTGFDASCPEQNLGFTNPTGLSIPVPKGTTTQVEVPDLFSLQTGAPSACQGRDFTATVRLTFATAAP